MRFRAFIVLLASCLIGWKACAQGLSLRDTAFVGSLSGGSGGGGTSGGGTPAPSPGEYWDMQEASGNRVGEISGTTLVPSAAIGSGTGLYGNMAQWSSTADLVATMPAYTSGQSISVNYWQKWVTYSVGAFMPDFTFYTDNENDYLYAQIDADAGPPYELNAYLVNNATEEFVTGTFTASLDYWLMVTLVYDGGAGTLTLYLNGVAEGTTPSVTLGSDSDPALRFDAGSGNETGGLDEVYFKYGYAFTADDVTWLYNAGAGRQFSDF